MSRPRYPSKLSDRELLEWFRARVRRWEKRTLVVLGVVLLIMLAIATYVIATTGTLPPDVELEHYRGRGSGR